MWIFIHHSNSFSSVLIAPVRKNKKWKHRVQLCHGKPVCDQQRGDNEMVLIMVIIHNLTSVRLLVGFAESRPGVDTRPSGGLLVQMRGAGGDRLCSGHLLAQGPLELNCVRPFNCPDTQSLLRVMANE